MGINMQDDNIIVNKYYGGLGNQMFQYVFGLNLEQKEKTVVADTSWYSENCVPLGFAIEDIFSEITIRRNEEKVKLINERLKNRWIGTKILNRLIPSTNFIYLEQNEFVYDKKALETNKWAVSGYWQCYKYVDNVSDKLKKSFSFSHHNLDESVLRVIKCIENSNCSVFIHIRGGDYASNLGAKKLFGNICTADYYKNAVAIIKDKLTNPTFYVFTNDRKYAEDILQEENVNYISDIVSKSYEDWIDLMLMSKCEHGIIANSSFSWWGAWLPGNSEKIIIAPKRWTNKHLNTDICMPNWIKI